MPVRDGRGTESRHIEETHVYKVYNQIAPKFSNISQKAWPNVRRFLKDLQPGSFVADIGCGSGRYLPINNKLTKIGVDICCPLVQSARSKGHEVAVADNLHIPFRDQTFDAVISIGVIHHFSTRGRRLAAIRELSRVVQKGGQLMIYVWAFEQKKRKFESQDVLVPWHGGNKETFRAGLSSQNSFSEKDSSTLSLASSNGSQPEPPHAVLLRSISDPADSVFTSHTLNEVDTYIKSLPENGNKITKRHRCNTLPSSLEGILSDEEHEEGYHSNGNILASACRKLEASLKAMSSSEYHLVDSEDVFQDTEMEIERNGICVENGISKNWKKRKNEDFTSGSDLFVDFDNDCVNRNFCQITGKKKQGNGEMKEKISQTNKTYQNGRMGIKSSGFVISGAKMNDNERQLLKKQLSNDKGEIKSQNNNHSSCHDTTSQKPKPKVSVFQSLKESFLKLIENKPQKKDRKSSKSSQGVTSIPNPNVPEIVVPELDTYLPADFAVREFPQSSCPVYRMAALESSKKLDNLELKPSVEFSISGSSPNISEGSSNFNDEDGNVSCVCGLANGNGNITRHGKQDMGTSSKGNNSGGSDHLNIISQSEVSPHQTDYKGKSFTVSGSCHFKNGSQDINGEYFNATHGNGTHSETISGNFKSSYIDSNQEHVAEQGSKTFSNGVSQLKDQKSRSEVLLSNSLPLVTNKNKIDKKSSQSLTDSPKCVPSDKSTLPKNQNETEEDESLDVDSKDLSRYYHVFKDGELSRLISKHIHCLRIISSTYDHGNWCIVAEKL